MKPLLACYLRRDGHRGIRSFRGRNWNVGILIEPRDLWVGWFWDIKQRVGPPPQNKRSYVVHCYRSVLPCVVIHAWFDTFRDDREGT